MLTQAKRLACDAPGLAQSRELPNRCWPHNNKSIASLIFKKRRFLYDWKCEYVAERSSRTSD